MLRQIDRCRLVACRLIVDDQPIVIRERVSHCCTKSPWIALFHVRAGVIESDTDACFVPERFGIPDDFVKPPKAAVQTVRAIVDSEAVGRFVERESSTGNPVAVAADDRAEVWTVMEITG